MMEKILKQLGQFWATRDGKQRGFLLGGAVATLALLAFFTHLAMTPDMKPVMTGLEPADAQALSQTLTAKGIQNAVSPDGKQVLVPAEKLDAARVEAVSGNGAPHSGRMGFEIFDKVSWGQTEFDEKVNYQRAIEGELERTIITMGGIKSARVHVVMATDSVFLDQQRGAKASVTVKLSGAALTHEEVRAIQRLLAGAVDGLKMNDVAVIDADSGQSLGTGDDTNGDEGETEKRLEKQLVATLTPVLGADHLRASVNVERDPGTTEQSSEKYDPSVSVPLTVQRSDEETGAGAGSSGVAGASSNLQTGKASTPNVPNVPGDGAEVAKTENSTFGVNKVVMRTVEPGGRVRRITAAVLVDDAVIRRPLPKGKFEEQRVKRSPEELKQIQDLASAAIGLDTARGDVLTVEDMSFNQPTVAEVPAPSMLDKVRNTTNKFSDVLRYGFLLTLFVLAYFLVLRPMQTKVMSAPLMPKTPELPPEPKLPQLPAIDPSEEALHSQALREELVQMVKAEPRQSAEAVQVWLQGEKS